MSCSTASATKPQIEKIRTGIEKDFGVKAGYSPADMTKPAEIADMVRATEKEFGALDVLVNNAGIQHVANIEDFPIEKWDAIIADQPLVVVSHYSCRHAWHEDEKMGPHHQHRIRAWTGGQRAKGGLHLSQTWACRTDKSGRVGSRE